MSTPLSDNGLPLHQRLKALSPERRAAVQWLLQERQRSGAIRESAACRLRETSFGQQRLWFLTQLDPESPVYNTVTITNVETPVDLSSLTAAINTLIERHESLRTTFDIVDGKLWQRINPPWLVNAEIGFAAPDFVRKPFDLVRGPLLRVSVEVETGRLVICVHHLVTDGWSMGIFLREFAALYAAHREGRTLRLEALPMQYADFAELQRSELSGDRLTELLDFWRTELADLSSLDLVTDRPRSAAPSFKGGSQSLVFPRRTLERLRALTLER
ncbi:MAG: hypothetical protein JO076_13720, partial [Verrucomicrobia bacterium]|nr:hypothetical protein [Verrucomicrobiota bacterium]